MTDWVDLGLGSRLNDGETASIDQKIDSMQNELDLGAGELKQLRETIEKARVLVLKFPSVRFYEKSNYTRKIVEINEDLAKFCDIDLQLLQYRNQLTLLGVAGNLVDKVDGLSKRMDGLMSVPVPVFRDLCSVPKLDKVVVGLDWPLMELKKRLLDDVVVNLVVSAPPGTPNFRIIVQNLLQHSGYAPHTFENDSQATVGLRKLLEELREDGPILLVLDDVWRGSESLLQKFRINLPDYKILVTSRFDFPSFGYNYRLKPLENEDAKALLIQWASRPHNTSQAEYEDLLQKILKRCNGFPIVESWSQGETILDSPSQPTVLECLQPSFSALEPNLKECFLDMGSFLEDQKIRASVIIDIWMELYGKNSSILCMKYLEDLASQNLLKLVPLGNETEDGFYNEFLVTQHDILRELAIRQSELEAILERKRLNLEIKEDTFPDWCLNAPRNTVVNASLLSISTVEALVLNLSSPDYALPSFIAGMTKLKVLTITNHGFYPARLRNFSCLSLLPNLKRIRLEKVSVTLLDIPRLQLASLKKLSLVMCSFGEVFYDSEEIDVSKALPSLQEIDIDYCYDLYELPYWVSEVVSLKTLSITNCNKLTVLPEAIGNLSKLEVLRVSSCINLSELPETTDRLSNLRFLDISHCLGLRKLPLKIGKLQKLKKISMRKCWRCELPDSVRDLEDLEVKCEEETRLVLWERLMPKMRNLRVHEEETEHNLNLLQIKILSVQTIMDWIQSFDALPHNLRECFLDMGSFLKDQKIIASTIIDLWSELHDKENIIYMNYLQELASHNLLKLLPLGKNKYEDGFFNEFLVKQDNILREFAIHQWEKESLSILERKRLNLDIQDNKFPNWCLNLEHPVTLNVSLLSISTDDSFTSCWVEMHCPNVEVLVLNLSSSTYALPNFVATMKKLKVVMVINHGFELTKLTNLSCLSLLPNLRRIRFEKVSITLHDIPKLQLKCLAKLSLWLCHFNDAPNELEDLEVDVTETLQSLQEIEIDYCYNLVELPHWVSQVVSLKKLSITNCNKLCRLLEGIGSLRNLEMLRVISCSNLFELPKTSERLSNLRLLDVSGCFQLKTLPLEIGKLQKLKKISMRDCYRCELPDSVKNLEDLEVRCDEGTVFLWERFKQKMKNLTIIEEETEHNSTCFNCSNI
ncbi:hypothetical protein HID58_094491 [Brassica napus]|uniref:RPW8 domain-containing protein n=1 Tax=Brassica napus TaxID=3708 RepID=A0ABQ7X756_BRANA|nr:hypothetical protein HID58_094491 [Brassica napus]